MTKIIENKYFTANVSEGQLENYLCDNLEKHFPHLKIIKRQYKIPEGRIDLLCKDTNNYNTYVVVELKIGDITPDTVCQALRYTQYLNLEKSKTGKRKFYPLVIGSNLEDKTQHIQKLLRYYDDYEEGFYCYYRLFNIDENFNFNFEYYNIINKEYIDSNYKEIFIQDYKALEQDFAMLKKHCEFFKDYVNSFKQGKNIITFFNLKRDVFNLKNDYESRMLRLR